LQLVADKLFRTSQNSTTTVEPGLCTRNLLRALTDYNLDACSIFATHHNGAMFPLQKSVRGSI